MFCKCLFVKRLILINQNIKMTVAYKLFNYYPKLLKNNLKFISYYLHPKHHKNVGAIMPSSKYLASSIVSTINTDSKPKRILEVGAGTGVFTKFIVNKLNPNDTLDIVEINKSFAKSLQKTYNSYPNITVHNLSILEFNSNQQYDYIISGLPFNYFPSEIVENILTKYNNLLINNGIISYFEYAFISNIKKLSGYSKNNMIDSVITKFKKSFTVNKNTVYRNIPPAIVWHLKK